MALRHGLKKQIAKLNGTKEKDFGHNNISWRVIEDDVAEMFQMRRKNITALRKQFLADGDVMVFGEYEDGAGECAYASWASPLNTLQLREVERARNSQKIGALIHHEHVCWLVVVP